MTTIPTTVEGTICHIVLHNDFGFIETSRHQPHVFFHRTALSSDLAWSEQLLERRVQFLATTTPKGIKAVVVRPAD